MSQAKVALVTAAGSGMGSTPQFQAEAALPEAGQAMLAEAGGRIDAISRLGLVRLEGQEIDAGASGQGA